MTANDLHPSMLPPEVTPERLERLEEWVLMYTASVRESWIEDGTDVDDPEVRKALAVVAESMRCRDVADWMPLAEASSVYKIELAMTPEAVSPDRLRNALRTYKTATSDEIDASICNQMGWDPASLDDFRNSLESFGNDTGRTDECALYRYYDADGRLLYVGISKAPGMRDEQHRANSKWHRFHADRTVDWYPTRDDAHDAERDAIQGEAPVFNLTHASAKQRAAALDYLFAQIGGAS